MKPCPLVSWLLAGLVLGCGPKERGPAGKSAPTPSPATTSLVAGPATGPKTGPARLEHGFWSPFADIGRVFMLEDTLREAGEVPRRLEIEVVRVHKVGESTVAVMDWTIIEADKRTPADAVFDAVVMRGNKAAILFDYGKASDDSIRDWAASPLPYDGMPKEGDEMFERLSPSEQHTGIACLRRDESVEGEDCEDTCEGTLCLREGDGLIYMDMLLAPEWGFWAKKGFSL